MCSDWHRLLSSRKQPQPPPQTCQPTTHACIVVVAVWKLKRFSLGNQVRIGVSSGNRRPYDGSRRLGPGACCPLWRRDPAAQSTRPVAHGGFCEAPQQCLWCLPQEYRGRGQPSLSATGVQREGQGSGGIICSAREIWGTSSYQVVRWGWEAPAGENLAFRSLRPVFVLC